MCIVRAFVCVHLCMCVCAFVHVCVCVYSLMHGSRERPAVQKRGLRQACRSSNYGSGFGGNSSGNGSSGNGGSQSSDFMQNIMRLAKEKRTQGKKPGTGAAQPSGGKKSLTDVIRGNKQGAQHQNQQNNGSRSHANHSSSRNKSGGNGSSGSNGSQTQSSQRQNRPQNPR